MQKQILARIILPSETFLEMEADLVNIPGLEGEIGILAGHAELIVSLQAGLATLFIEQVPHKYYLAGGVAEVNQQEVNIVTEFAVSLADTNKEYFEKEIISLEAELGKLEANSSEYELIADKISKRKLLINFL